MTGEPSQYPFPVQPGGLGSPDYMSFGGGGQAVYWPDSLRSFLGGGPTPGAVRQPFLGQTPRVSQVTGMGTGSGAGVANNGSDADQSQGIISIKVGTSPSASGFVQLFFPNGIVANQYVAFAEWATLSQGGIGGGFVNVNWTATRTLIPGETLILAYQWAVST